MSSASARTSQRSPWNHNLQFHPWVLAKVPVPCEHALDVGCGDGVLTPKLAARSTHATGIDISSAMIDLARAKNGRDNIEYVAGDVLSYPLRAEGFDFIAAVAVIHHMPLGSVFGRLARLLRPRGVLAAVGLARNRSLVDYAMSAASVPISRLVGLRRGCWESPAPQLDADTSFDEIKALARDVLPGVQLRRRLLFRYTLLWRKP